MERKKLSWAYMQTFLPDIDHAEFNALRNGAGRKVGIPVTLYKDDVAVLSAEVRMLSSAAALYTPALWVLLKECEQSGVGVDWDEVSFTSSSVRFPKDEIMKWEENSFSAWMQMHHGKDFSHMLMLVTDELSMLPQEKDLVRLRQKFNDVASHMAASFQLQSAEIVSKDLDQMKSDRKWTSRTVKGIKTFLGMK